jgi:hypothetical protein
MTQATPTPETPAEELKRLRQERAARDEQAQAEEDGRELEELRLDARLSGELGKRGKDYELVNTPFGVFGVRTPDSQGIAAWDRITGEKTINTDKLTTMLRHYVVPIEKQVEFHQVATDRPAVAHRVGTAFAALLGSERLEGKKKF